MNRIEELNKNIEDIFAQRNLIEAELEHLVKKELLNLFGQEVGIAMNCSISFWHNVPRCVFSVGFINEEGKKDFGSDFDLYYEKREIGINNGTVGTYTKHHKFQVLRVKLFNAIWENIEKLEKVFEDFGPQFDKYEKLLATMYNYQNEIDDIKRKEKEEAFQKIEQELKVDDYYQEISRYGNRGRIYKITKITNKLIYTEHRDRWTNWTKQFKKDEFILEIYSKGLEKVENPGLNS